MYISQYNVRWFETNKVKTERYLIRQDNTIQDLSRDERPALSVSGLVTGVSEPYLDIDT